MLGVIQLLSRKTGCLASFKVLARRKHVNFLLILKMKSRLCKTVFIIEICGSKETGETVKNPPACRRPGFSPWVRKIPRSGLPFPTPGGLPDPGVEPRSPALAGRFFTTEPRGKSNKGNREQLLKIQSL